MCTGESAGAIAIVGGALDGGAGIVWALRAVGSQ